MNKAEKHDTEETQAVKENSKQRQMKKRNKKSNNVEKKQALDTETDYERNQLADREMRKEI